MMTKQYGVILADPPWRYRVYDDSDTAHGAARSHYPTMDLEQIKTLPAQELAARDCALFLWVTPPCLPEGLEVIRAWGFRYVTKAFSPGDGGRGGMYGETRSKVMWS